MIVTGDRREKNTRRKKKTSYFMIAGLTSVPSK
jgi:hypothetical protein